MQTTSAMAVPLLVLVHPGSACGSADFHHGRRIASAERDELARVLRGWKGDLVVVDSDLSVEIPGYHVLSDAIDQAIATAAGHGRHASRLLAGNADADYDEADWVGQARDHVVALGHRQALVTGAWLHADDDGGCVNAVRDELARAGLLVIVDDSALPIDLE